MNKFTPMEKHFIRWYEDNKDTFRDKVHRKLNPNCKLCKSDDLAYKELFANCEDLV